MLHVSATWKLGHKDGQLVDIGHPLARQATHLPERWLCYGLSDSECLGLSMPGSVQVEGASKEGGSGNEDLPASSQPLSLLVARQPIFDSSLKVVAYELLYRTEGRDTACVVNAVRATADVIAGAMFDIGLDRLVGDSRAFINFPPDLLVPPLQLPLPPDRIVIELLEGALPTKTLIEGLSQMKSAGYQIALDDFDIHSDSVELLAYADIVKLDIQQNPAAELLRCVQELRQHPLQLLAEKVETAEELAHCRDLGFDLYQGYFLQRPETLVGRRAPSSRLAALELILSLEEGRTPADRIEACITRDVGLSYRLLRSINSSYYRTPRRIESIRQAILLLGYAELRRICSVILLTSIEDRPAYVAVQALMRARMCESLCSLAGLSGVEGYFMAGLLSMADVLLGMPMEECLSKLPISGSLREALLRKEGPIGAALCCALNYERGLWEQARFENLTPAEIGAAYAQGVHWADEACASMGLSH